MLNDIANLRERFGPVPVIVMATLLVITGLLIILNPVLLAYLMGIALILAGVAALAFIFTAGSKAQF